MNAEEYSQISQYLINGQLPEHFSSTKGNFISKCRKYTMDGTLLKRGGKRVLRECELEETWAQIHNHAGINVSWAKINGNHFALRKLILI